MVDKEYIEKSINLIFDVENRSIKRNKTFHYVETSSRKDSIKNEGSLSIPIYPARPPLADLQLSPNDNWELQWETYTNLKKLYNKTERYSGCRKIFLNIIEKKLSGLGALAASVVLDSPVMIYTTESLHSNASLAFYFLLKIGSNNAIIRALQTKTKESVYLDSFKDSDSGELLEFEVYSCRNDVEGLFTDILVFMHVEPTHFDELLLDQLAEIINYNYSVPLKIKEKFEDKIVELKYNNLKVELEPSNEEINIHKEQVIRIISKYGFSPEMEKFLLEIDELPDLSNWKSVNSGMIGNLRSFFEVLVKSIAGKIKAKTGREYPKPEGDQKDMGIKRKYIKDHLGLSDEGNKLITSYVDILNKEGSHALISEKRYFAMTKNIGIEIAYFLLSAYEEKFETPNIS